MASRAVDARRVLGFFEAAAARAGTRWAVIGVLAMNAYGYARATLDVDVAAEEGGAASSWRRSTGRAFRSRPASLRVNLSTLAAPAAAEIQAALTGVYPSSEQRRL